METYAGYLGAMWKDHGTLTLSSFLSDLFFSFLLRLWLDFLFEYSISNDISFGTRWWDTLPPQKITNGHQKIHIKHLIRRVLWKNTRGVFRIHLLGVKTGVFFFSIFQHPVVPEVEWKLARSWSSNVWSSKLCFLVWFFYVQQVRRVFLWNFLFGRLCLKQKEGGLS